MPAIVLLATASPGVLLPPVAAQAPARASAWGEPLPWQEAGLSERQAAVHLLNRLTYGPRPGEVEKVLEMGLRNWLEWQLAGDPPGPEMQARLESAPALALSPREILRRFPHQGMLIDKAVKAGVVRPAALAGNLGEGRRQQAYRAVAEYADAQGYRPHGEVLEQLRAQKLQLALYSESQLVEVLADFWFNHFNVMAVSIESRMYLPSYERDAVRPYVLASFRELLGAIARHPAMLTYLGNAFSQAEPGTTTSFDLAMERLGDFSPLEDPTARQALVQELKWKPRAARRQPLDNTRLRREGLNENYARELLELHTLGVDGGYDQDDVIEVARAFTGWTFFPQRNTSPRFERALMQAVAETELGFVYEDGFLFRPDHHDAGAKTFLGVRLPEGRGIEDGEEVLDVLARHPSTARHLAHKLAARFVADDPPPALVRRLVRTFELTGGGLRETMRTLVESPEFWAAGRNPSKLKSPFELVVSALRALDADVTDGSALIQWIHKAGQPLYAYPAPTGFPDREEAWADVGPLLHRLNLAAQLTAAKVGGVSFDLLALIDGEPDLESYGDAVAALLPVFLPARRPGEALAGIAFPPEESQDDSGDAAPAAGGIKDPEQRRRWNQRRARFAAAVLLGSPQFQRR